MENLPENNLQTSISRASLKTVEALSKKFVDLNKLVPYPLDGKMLISWAVDIERLVPRDDLKKIPFLFDCFMTEELEWDKNKGIQNIFSGLKWIRWDEEQNKFKLLKPFYQ